MTAQELGKQCAFYMGLTKREHFAAMALQGLLSADNGGHRIENLGNIPMNAAKWSVIFADALLEALVASDPTIETPNP